MRTILLMGLVGAVAAAQALPAGFVDDLVVGGFTNPIGVAAIPDGRILVIERSGAVHVVAQGLVGMVGAVPAVRAGAEGLIGITVDPAWPSRPMIYVLYEHDATPNLHLARFELTGQLTSSTSPNLALGPQYMILTDIPDASGGHNGGTLRFGPDGMLYASLGDDGVDCSAQDPTVLGGCVLRLDVAGLPPGPGGPPAKASLVAAGNPFAGTGPNASLLWATGLREPFRFHIDPQTGALFIADVGDLTFEEINIADVPGLNFGWPWFEGPAPATGCAGPTPGGLQPPAAVRDRSLLTGPSALISLSLYRSDPSATWDFGSAYDGSYFYVDYFAGRIRRLVDNGTQWVAAPAVAGQPTTDAWGLGYGGVADAVVAPNGGLYYVGFVSGSLRVIHPSATTNVVTVASGGGQVGTALQPLAQPISVAVTDPTGAPVAGIQVTFLDTANSGGTFGPQPVVTDSMGIASTTYVLGPQPASLAAADASGGTVAIPLVWRGLGGAAGFHAGTTFALLAIQHSAVGSPFTIAVDPFPLTTPVPTPYGDIWTSILSPGPVLAVLDGLGVVGPPNPTYVTGSDMRWANIWWNIPASLSGVSLLCQGYAADPALAPPADILVTNPVTIILP